MSELSAMAENDPDILIHPRREPRERELPKRALLLANPAEARYGLQLLQARGGQPRTLYNSNLLVDEMSRFCLAGPALGAPAAGLVLEKLIALGVEEILLISCCGAVDPAFEVGDILLGSSAVSGVGLSDYYGAGRESWPQGETGVLLERALGSAGIDWRAATIWSTDAPYRERRSELIALQEEYGISGVDMEFAALCAICSCRKVSLAGLFVVSDILWSRSWQPGFGSDLYKQRSRDMIDLVVSFLRAGESS